MLTYNKMKKLSEELHSSYREIQEHLEFILADDSLVSVQNRVEEDLNLTVSFYDPREGMEFEALIADGNEFKQMMRFQTAEELLSFLSARTVA